MDFTKNREKMSIRKNLFIQHACMYTREGIKSTLSRLSCGNIDLTVIAEKKYLEISDYLALPGTDVDVFILGLQNTYDSYGNTLDFIIKWLPLHYPQAKVIIMAQTLILGRLKDYLSGLNNVSAVLDNAITINELSHYLQDTILNLPDVRQKSKSTTPLTHQEIKVLKYLLKGMPTLQVARTMQIHPKTVSAHKRAAMIKLGITSLHSLIQCQVNLNMMDNLLTQK
ncbi:LuxR C-terminal-related transcriptional regulator [Serratia sp. DD3]|uniref:helix-turn-helix transcriptional regulator n=1 Tax=Serratia sp. DD3 TaxID=1410619 RepID=UPI00135F18BA|nr:LuxR C-terminal-related transcriptional regulator [Serratia sp. DD3]